MAYKKLIGLLAVSTLALTACDADEDMQIDETGEEVDEAEETTEDHDAEDYEDEESSGESAHDIISSIDSDLGYTSRVELEITGGSWSQDGYIFTMADGEATVNGSAAAEGDAYAFVLQDGEVIDKPDVEEGVFTFTTSEAGEYVIGVSDEDIWEVGDEGDTDELVRSENVIVQAPEGE